MRDGTHLGGAGPGRPCFRARGGRDGRDFERGAAATAVISSAGQRASTTLHTKLEKMARATRQRHAVLSATFLARACIRAAAGDRLERMLRTFFIAALISAIKTSHSSAESTRAK